MGSNPTATAIHLRKRRSAPLGAGRRFPSWSHSWSHLTSGGGFHQRELITGDDPDGTGGRVGEWVKNGHQWVVTKIHPDGSVRVTRPAGGRVANLPAACVREHVELGYATTAHRAQGRTVETAHAYRHRDDDAGTAVRDGHPRARVEHALRRHPVGPRPGHRPRQPRAERPRRRAPRCPHPPRHRPRSPTRTRPFSSRDFWGVRRGVAVGAGNRNFPGEPAGRAGSRTPWGSRVVRCGRRGVAPPSPPWPPSADGRW